LDTDATKFWNINFRVTGDIENVFQELRLTGDMDRFRWMVGGNYSHDSVDETEHYDLAGSNSTLLGVRFPDGEQKMAQRVSTASVFGDVQYDLVPGLTVQGSARYTNYKDKFRGCLHDPGDGYWAAAISALANVLGASPPVSLPAGGCLTLVSSPTPPTLSAPPIIRKSHKEDNLSWRGGLSWKVSPDKMVYANVTRGYKSGGFPGVVGIVEAQFDPIGQESVLAYEAGFKLSLADRKVQLNGAGFYYEYKDKQLVGIVPNAAIGPTLALVSIPKSRIQGFELDGTIRATSQLTLNAAATYVDSKVVSSFILPAPSGISVDVRGEQLPTSPKWQLQGGADYTVPVSSAIDLHLGGSARYQTSSNATFGEDPNYVIHGYTILDAFGGIESSDGKWSAQIWGRNLLNKYFVTAILRGGDTISRSTGMGATYGLTLNYKY
jgi:outer membrane receptor protein involved in Fe transport